MDLFSIISKDFYNKMAIILFFILKNYKFKNYKLLKLKISFLLWNIWQALMIIRNIEKLI